MTKQEDKVVIKNNEWMEENRPRLPDLNIVLLADIGPIEKQNKIILYLVV